MILRAANGCRWWDGGDTINLGVVRVNRPSTPPPTEALAMQNTNTFKFDEITLLGNYPYKRGL